jgi:hypothetical protein
MYDLYCSLFPSNTTVFWNAYQLIIWTVLIVVIFLGLINHTTWNKQNSQCAFITFSWAALRTIPTLDLDSYPKFFFLKFGFKFREFLKLKFDSLLRDAAGSQISPLHYAAGSQISLLHFSAGSQVNDCGSNLLSVSCSGESNLPLHFAAGIRDSLLHL